MKVILSEPIVKRLIFMVKKLKKILLLGYMENNKIENEGRMKNGQQGIVYIWVD